MTAPVSSENGHNGLKTRFDTITKQRKIRTYEQYSTVILKSK